MHSYLESCVYTDNFQLRILIWSLVSILTCTHVELSDWYTIRPVEPRNTLLTVDTSSIKLKHTKTITRKNVCYNLQLVHKELSSFLNKACIQGFS